MTPNARRNERPETGGARRRSRLAAAALSLSLLLAALAVSILVLPVTALAVEGAPNSLYVGDQQVINGNKTTFWTTDKSTGRLTEYEGNDDNWNVKYDPSTVTLSLQNAKISGGNATTSPPYGAGIYAPCSSNQSVALTIELFGTNTITGYFGIYVNANQGTPSGADASLVIKNGGNNGSLTVTGTGNSGLLIASGTGNASLTIENASVDAKTTQTYSGYAGVCVQSGATATNSPNISLSVDGGSLTASGTGNNDGILFYVGSSQATGATTSLTVSENAIVDAKTGGIKASDPNLNDLSDQIVVGSGTGTSGGIVFDGTESTVYGDVTLQENLEIGEGESLAIGDGASLNTGSHEVIVNGGTLTGGDKITGTVRYAPTITTESLPNGTVNEEYSQTLAADGDATITWSSSNLPEWLTLDSATGVISGTPTTEGTNSFTVKAENSYGSDSREYTLTIDPKQEVSVTGVSLSATSLTLTEKETAALTAAVEPTDATNQKVTWSSSDSKVATVDANGKVTAVDAGTAAITVTTADGGKTASCEVTVTAKTYGISASPTALSFGSVYVGYAQPAAQTVTVTNMGNQSVTLTQPTSASYEIGNLSSTELEPNDTATFTVQPKPGLSVGTYAETLAISGSDGVSTTVSLSFSISSRPYIPPTPSGPDWHDVTGEIADAVDGGRVVVDMGGETVLPGEVLEALAGCDVTLVLEMGDDVSWEIWGGDVPEGTSFSDTDMGVELGTDSIPAGVVDLVTGERGSVQVTLEHDGPFGFELTLVAPLGKDVAGMYASLYRYDDDAEALGFEVSGVVDEDGTARLEIDHASQWLVALDSHPHELPFPDASEGQWYSEAVRWAWLSGTMTGYGDGSGLFGTEASLSRAEMATVLWRLAGEPASSRALPADCDGSAFYAGAVSWALGEGCFTGYDGGSFGPADALTREQAATVLWRLAGKPGTGADLSSFPDAGEVSGFAEAAVRWAVSEGVLSGTGEGLLEPGRAVTRAEMAAVLMRLEASGL